MKIAFWAIGALRLASRGVVRHAGESPEVVISPFAETAPATASGGGDSEALTVAAVDAVLDSVRPYLIADGGNVEVVEVTVDAPRRVVLQLQGACGTCPSSTTTMKMGIERVLKERWPDVEVLRAEEVQPPLSIEFVTQMLAPITSAVAKLGGSARVVSAGDVEEGLVEIEYKGPANVRFGVELTLKDSPVISEVRFIDPPAEA